jgi:hypothetical protein
MIFGQRPELNESDEEEDLLRAVLKRCGINGDQM